MGKPSTLRDTAVTDPRFEPQRPRAPDKGEVGGSSPPRPTNFLLHETDAGSGTAFRHFLDGAKLRFVAGDIFAQCAKDALGVARTDDHAFEQLALLAVGENIDKVQRKFLEIVVNHHQIAVLAL